MNSIPVELIQVGRVLTSDNDMLVLEVSKSDDVEFTLDPEGPNDFYTLAFIRIEEGRAIFFNPFE